MLQIADAGNERPRILLAAPNVSRQMGGEAIKALFIFEGYRALGFDVTQVTHARVRAELSEYGFDQDIVYVEDGPIQIALYKLRLDWLLGFVGSWLLHRQVQRQVDIGKPWIVHFTAPISPTTSYFRIRGAPTVIGPLNGNLLHPPALLSRESRGKLLGARLTGLVQRMNRVLFRGRQEARLFVSGGERTARVLELGGCRRDRMVFTLDSGVDGCLSERPRIQHAGPNSRFVFLGRLVRYKGCDLVIKALRHVPEATLEVIGEGGERDALVALAEQEGVSDRVEFHDYTTDREALFRRLSQCRAFVFPTLAEANGIVIQEMMMLGLPVVCVNWGGPQQLLDPTMAVLIEPESEVQIIRELAEAMGELAGDADRADLLSGRARARAEREGFAWPRLLRNWLSLYDRWLEECGSAKRFTGPSPDPAEKEPVPAQGLARSG